MQSPAGRQLIELMAGFWKTQAVYIATESGIVDHIPVDGRIPAIELALETGTDPDALGRLLLFLESLGVVDGDETNGYALTPVGELLRTDTRDSMRDHVRIYGSHFYQAWGALSHSLRTGGSAFTHVYGSDLFSYLHQNPELSLTYERAMVAGTPFFAEVSGAFDFSGARRIVDVAGGHGALLNEILNANPGPRAVLFDAAHVIEEAAAVRSPRTTRTGANGFPGTSSSRFPRTATSISSPASCTASTTRRATGSSPTAVARWHRAASW